MVARQKSLMAGAASKALLVNMRDETVSLQDLNSQIKTVRETVLAIRDVGEELATHLKREHVDRASKVAPSFKHAAGLEALEPAVLRRLAQSWALLRHPLQAPPPGAWRNWLLMGGRGSGKTRAGAEWIHEIASRGEKSTLRIALVAETLGDAREVMVDGLSGIARIARHKRPEVEISRRRLVWPNGSVAQIFSSEDPESLRGPQFHYAWCDDLHYMISSTYVKH